MVRATSISHQVLVWARNRAGLSLEDVASSFGKSVEEIEAWETGSAFPTYNQLEKLARSLYKVPVAVFFFPSPPDIEEPLRSFRTLPDVEIERLLPDTRFAIREAKTRQLFLAEMNDESNPIDPAIFDEIKLSVSDQLTFVAERIRNYFGVSTDDQFSWDSAETAFKKWRNAIEKAGVMVFKRPFKQREISGFCLYDDEFPVICVSNSTAHSRQVFTLFHELGHVLCGLSSVTHRDLDNLSVFSADGREVEIFCNRLASEILVPSAVFRNTTSSFKFSDQTLRELASLFSVSREVILRKLLDTESITQTLFNRALSELNEEYLREHEKEGGGNYYSNVHTYLGPTYIRMAFSRFHENKCSLEQLVEYLGVKARNLTGIEQIVA